MKLFILSTLFIFNVFAWTTNIDRINYAYNPVMERIAEKTQLVFNQTDLAPVESVYRFQHNSTQIVNPRGMIENTLYDMYIDDQQAFLAQTDDQSLKEVAKLLNYRNVRGDRAVNRALKIVETELKGLRNDNHLLLFSLKSMGYGSFGEANGFAIFDRENKQFIIVQSGYAE